MLLVTIVLLCSHMITTIIVEKWTSTAILKHLMVQPTFDSQTMQEGIKATTIVYMFGSKVLLEFKWKAINITHRTLEYTQVKCQTPVDIYCTLVLSGVATNQVCTGISRVSASQGSQ